MKTLLALTFLALSACTTTADWTDADWQQCRDSGACGASYASQSHFNPAAVYQPPIHVNPDGQGGYSVYQQPNPFAMWR